MLSYGVLGNVTSRFPIVEILWLDPWQVTFRFVTSHQCWRQTTNPPFPRLRSHFKNAPLQREHIWETAQMFCSSFSPWAEWNSVYSETPPTTSRRKVIVHKCQITSYLRLYDCINVFLRYRNRIFILSPTYIFTPSFLKKPLNYHIVAFHSKTKTFMFLFLNDIYFQ